LKSNAAEMPVRMMRSGGIGKNDAEEAINREWRALPEIDRRTDWHAVVQGWGAVQWRLALLIGRGRLRNWWPDIKIKYGASYVVVEENPIVGVYYESSDDYQRQNPGWDGKAA
jgi:hypothetical protein